MKKSRWEWERSLTTDDLPGVEAELRRRREEVRRRFAPVALRTHPGGDDAAGIGAVTN